MKLSEVIERLKKEDHRKICPVGLKAHMPDELVFQTNISIADMVLSFESIVPTIDDRCYIDDEHLMPRLLDYMIRDAYLPEQEDAHRLARAVLAGDDDAVLLLADEVLLRNKHGKDYVPRDEAISRAYQDGGRLGTTILLDALRAKAVKIAAETEAIEEIGEARKRYARENMMRQIGDRLTRAFESGHWYAVRLTSETKLTGKKYAGLGEMVRMQTLLEITPLDGGKVNATNDG